MSYHTACAHVSYHTSQAVCAHMSYHCAHVSYHTSHAVCAWGNQAQKFPWYKDVSVGIELIQALLLAQFIEPMHAWLFLY